MWKQALMQGYSIALGLAVLALLVDQALRIVHKSVKRLYERNSKGELPNE